MVSHSMVSYSTRMVPGGSQSFICRALWFFLVPEDAALESYTAKPHAQHEQVAMQPMQLSRRLLRLISPGLAGGLIFMLEFFINYQLDLGHGLLPFGWVSASGSAHKALD